MRSVMEQPTEFKCGLVESWIENELKKDDDPSMKSGQRNGIWKTFCVIIVFHCRICRYRPPASMGL